MPADLLQGLHGVGQRHHVGQRVHPAGHLVAGGEQPAQEDLREHHGRHELHRLELGGGERAEEQPEGDAENRVRHRHEDHQPGAARRGQVERPVRQAGRDRRLGDRRGVFHRHDIGPGHHDLAHHGVTKLEDRVYQFLFFVLDHALFLAHVDQHAHLLLGHERPGGEGAPSDQQHERPRQQRCQAHDWRSDPADSVGGRVEGQGGALGVALGERLGHRYPENQYHNRPQDNRQGVRPPLHEVR